MDYEFFTPLQCCVQALLLSEKQAAEEAKKACIDAESKILDLAKKLEEAEGKAYQLQDSAQRYSHGKCIKNCPSIGTGQLASKLLFIVSF